MTKLISIAIVVVLLWGGWQFYLYWVGVRNDESKQVETTAVNPAYLGGMPNQLQDSYNKALQGGPKAMGIWLANCDSQLQDPRKAWIQLDYIVSIARENPQEAKRIFEDVKNRIPQSSQIWPRIKQMEAAFE